MDSSLYTLDSSSAVDSEIGFKLNTQEDTATTVEYNKPNGSDDVLCNSSNMLNSRPSSSSSSLYTNQIMIEDTVRRYRTYIVWLLVHTYILLLLLLFTGVYITITVYELVQQTKLFTTTNPLAEPLCRHN